MAQLFIALASSLLPSSVRSEVRAEWLAEMAWLESEGHNTIAFSLRVARSAPMVSIASRAGTSTAFAELSLALLFGVFSSVTFGVVSYTVAKPAMGTAYIGTAIGTLFVSLGLWREEHGLFQGRLAHAGLLLIAISRGFLATVPIHIPTQSELRARDDYALTVVAIGTLIIFVAQLPRFRNLLWTRIGLLIAGVASLAGGGADLMNLFLLDETLAVDVSLVVAAITAFGAGIATLVVVRRDVVFEPV